MSEAMLPAFADAHAEGVEWPDRPRVLLSYAYASKMTGDDFDRFAGDDVDIIIDSGAFTALNSGKPVDHDAYLAWLEEHGGHITAAFALDVIGDPVASRDNFITGVKRLGCAPFPLIPTWHIGSPWRFFEELCDLTGYVAVGGAVKLYQQQNELARISGHAHDIAARRGAHLHGLGMTGRRVMYQFPWASVDSSSWTIPARMPLIYLANEHGRMVSVSYGHALPRHHEALVNHYGGEPRAMEVEGFCMVKTVGAEIAHRRQEWGKVASCRSYQYVEAFKRWSTGHDFRIYLAATPTDREPITAHRIGNPYPKGTP